MNERERQDWFAERGYLPPVRVFGPQESRRTLARLRRARERPPLDWRKGHAATSDDYYALAADDMILDLVTVLIGENVLLWGAYLVTRRPGQAHAWHTDIESSAPRAESVSVWIGLAGTDARSSLKLVPFSHRFGVTVQQVAHERGKGRDDVSDADVAEWARERELRSEVLTIGMGNGEALVFDGRLWHGSHNTRPRGTRHAVLLQYATPATPIRAPKGFAWPFEAQKAPKPPCIVVSGRDVEGANRTVPGPVRAGDGLAALSSRIDPIHLPLEQDPAVGWKPHVLFRGSTPDIADLRCHASVLDPDRQPHPPHRHDEEELLVILDGEADLVVQDGSSPDGVARRRAARGTFAYYPNGFAHTIHNVSDAPVTYLMLKWLTDRKDRGIFLDHRLVSFWPAYEELRSGAAQAYASTAVLDGETRYLRHLHAHVTVLQPGGGYDPHTDAYDVAILVLDGTVETLGEQAGPNSVVFYAAGQPHGMRNAGDVPAAYLVFELHGRHSNSGRLARRRRRRSRPRRALDALRHARRLVAGRT